MKPKRYRYSTIYRAIFTFVGFVCNKIIHNEGAIFIFLKMTRKRVKCPACGGRNRLLKDFYKGTVRDLDVGPKDCYITFLENKLKCKCGFRGYEKLDFSRPYSRCTIRFEKYV